VCVWGDFDIITSTLMHAIVISEVNMVYSVLWTAFTSFVMAVVPSGTITGCKPSTRHLDI